jgi:electron transport complex protein RnfD
MAAANVPKLVAGDVRPRWRRRRLEQSLLIGLSPVLVASVIRFGMDAVGLYVAGGLAALAGEQVYRLIFPNRERVDPCHALCMGWLVAMLCWPYQPLVPLALAVGLGVLGARLARHHLGNYLLHPAACAWVLLNLVFAPIWPHGKEDAPTAEGALNALGAAYRSAGGPESLRAAALYVLPDWDATLWGAGAGMIGAGSGVAILLGGLWLVFAGRVRWSLPASVLGAAIVTASVWPIAGADGGRLWFPLLHEQGGLPIGVPLVLYHLTCGALLLVAVYLAADTLATPLRPAGGVVFGIAIGFCTIGLRAIGGIEGAAIWALLIANGLVPLIDRITQPRRGPAAGTG